LKKPWLIWRADQRNFTWNEWKVIIAYYGHSEKKGSGSRRKFINEKTKRVLSVHEPHPKPVLKRYALEIIIDHLRKDILIGTM
jgi:hypothetical protein